MNNNVGSLKNSNEKLSEEIESTVKAWSDELNQIMDTTVRDFHKATYTAIDDYKKKVSEFEKISKLYMNKHEKFYKTLYFFIFVVIILLVGVLIKLLFF